MNKIIEIKFAMKKNKNRGEKEMPELAVQNTYEEHIIPATEIAKWFINKGLIEFENLDEGLDKLQRLLYFSQLINIVRNEKYLFDNEMYADLTGTIIDGVEEFYKSSILQFQEKVFYSNLNIYQSEEEVLNIVSYVFGNLSANELSEMNKLHESWKRAFNNPIINTTGNGVLKRVFKINNDEILSHDLDSIKKVLIAYETTKENMNKESIIINNITYYYNPSEIDINDDVIDALEKFKGTDKCYSIYYDESVGLVIY